MRRITKLCRSGMVILTLLVGSGTVWLLHSPRLWDMVECAVIMRFNIWNPQHWLQLLLWVK